MFDEKLKAALAAVQKPGRYTGGEPGCVYKDKAELDLRYILDIRQKADNNFWEIGRASCRERV